MEDTPRYPVCPHTLQACRKQLIAFKAELKRASPGMTQGEINRIARLAEMTIIDIDDSHMEAIPSNDVQHQA
jgi:hypothetical protein